jgi:hypothetical protein
MALGMGYGDDLNLLQKLPIDDGKRILVEHNALGAVKVWRIQPWPFMYMIEGRKKLLVKSVGSLDTFAQVPRMRGLDLPSGSGMIL